ncbi:hypothetical protein IEQ34_016631 [Dendrobium chrysotoxum]|uniref:Uncharacterized protein n=1 Tax=Dendrobium chrysotoxum TaxID=161865 RepID=A0AAV7GET4_DENCH|nr:hypothetical protein IEQ34_016631 [Dendrobium chrysotoxum]
MRAGGIEESPKPFFVYLTTRGCATCEVVQMWEEHHRRVCDVRGRAMSGILGQQPNCIRWYAVHDSLHSNYAWELDRIHSRNLVLILYTMSTLYALILQYLAQGHDVCPLIQLSFCLLDHGFIITFVNTELNHERVGSTIARENNCHELKRSHMVDASDG